MIISLYYKLQFTSQWLNMHSFHYLFSFLASMPSLSMSAPTTTTTNATTTLTSPYTISTSLLDKMKLYSQYSAAVYCPNNTIKSGGTLVKCFTGTCPDVEANGAFVYSNFNNVGFFWMAAMLIVVTSPFRNSEYLLILKSKDPVNKDLILVFRGSEGNGTQAQLAVDMIPCPVICATCLCHDGLYNTWVEVRDRIITMVTLAQLSFPNYTFTITGHSMGGIHASLAAAEFRTNGTGTTLYTYGQSHVGDENFANYVTAQGNNFRVTHTVDVAPRLNSVTLGYRHISPEYWIFEDVDEDFTVGVGQVRVLEGIDNLEGNQVSLTE